MDGFRVGTHVMLHSNDALRYIMGTAAVSTCVRKFTFVRVFSKSYSHVVFFFSIRIHIPPFLCPSSYLAPYSLLFVSLPDGPPIGHSCTVSLLNIVIVLQIQLYNEFRVTAKSVITSDLYSDRIRGVFMGGPEGLQPPPEISEKRFKPCPDMSIFRHI